MAGFNLRQVRANLEATKRILPVKLAKLTENHFTQAFALGRLDDKIWPEVNRRKPGTNEYKYPKLRGLSRRTSPILVRTGNLRRKTSKSISNATWAEIKLINDAHYAKAQNEGTDTIPARPYMVQTDNLTKLQKAEIDKQIMNIWRV